jgi:hypothetical protein
MKLRTFVPAVAAFAATAASASIPPAYEKFLPREQRAGTITYLTGGATHEEANALKRAAQEYPLELVFMERDGRTDKYLSDMPVRITDANGKVVFEGQARGPYFLARLPRGRYTVSTRWDAWSFQRHVSIGRDRQRVVFKWSKPGAVITASAPAPAKAGA